MKAVVEVKLLLGVVVVKLVMMVEHLVEQSTLVAMAEPWLAVKLSLAVDLKLVLDKLEVVSVKVVPVKVTMVRAVVVVVALAVQVQ